MVLLQYLSAHTSQSIKQSVTHQSVNQQISQSSVSQSTNQSVNQQISYQSVNHQISQSINKSVSHQSVNHQISQSINKSSICHHTPVSQSTNQSVVCQSIPFIISQLYGVVLLQYMSSHTYTSQSLNQPVSYSVRHQLVNSQSSAGLSSTMQSLSHSLSPSSGAVLLQYLSSHISQSSVNRV